MLEQFQYYAFISYKREDEKWAKWLQRRLENYRLPSIIRKKDRNLPVYIRPIFRDQTDLSGGNLEKSLITELLSSKYLIVVCSPNSAISTWVNKEVEVFIKNGRSEDIIPFIVDGVAHSSDINSECLPQALKNLPKEQELLGINVNERGKDVAFVKLVARILNLKFDILWRRYERALRIRKTISIFAGTIVLLLGLLYIDYTRTKAEYYVTFVDRWGIPEGRCLLANENVAGRANSYKFEYKRTPWGEKGFYKWRVIRVTNINSAGYPTTAGLYDIEEFSKYPIMNIEYKNGELSAITYNDTKSRPICRHEFSKYKGKMSCDVNIVRAEIQGESTFIPSLIRSSTTSMEFNGTPRIKRYTYDRDTLGFITKVYFHSNNDNRPEISRTPNENRCYGYSINLDSLSRISQIDFLDINGAITCGINGISRIQYKYDNNGNLIYRGTYDNENNLVLNKHGYAFYSAEYNKEGNCVSKKFFDRFLTLCINSDDYSIHRSVFDSHGNLIERSFFNQNDKPCLIKQYRIHKLVSKYDEKCRTIEQECLGIDSMPCMNNKNYCLLKRKYDDYGNIIEEKYFGVDKKLCKRLEGISRVVAEYENGNIIREAYFDTTGVPCMHKDGYSSYTAEYDEFNRKTAVYTWGINGELIQRNDMYAIRRIAYNDVGNVSEERFYDDNSAPCQHKNGYHIIRITNDELGNKTKEEYFGIDGKRCLSKYKLAVWNAVYDAKGYKIREYYLDTNLQPTENSYGIASQEFQNDEFGKILYTKKIDSEGNEVKSSNLDDILKLLNEILKS